MAQLHYENKDQINWKQVKEAWDSGFMFFQLVFMHDGHKIQFQSELDSSKKYRLMLYVDGFWEGKWMSTTEEHPYRKYHHKKPIGRTKSMKELDLANKKMAKLLKKQYKEPEPMYIYVPIFGNIAQVKKMVEGLK